MILGDPKEVASTILNRSVCAVQVGACIVDTHGIFAWGWNHSGFDGYGQHAESHAIFRANRRRLAGATMYVAAVRRRNGKVIPARPCEECQLDIDRCGMRVWWRDSKGVWKRG